MSIKLLSISNLKLDGNIFLAPMAGYTDYAFRSVAADLGYAMTFTELTSAKGLFFGGENTKSLLNCGGDYSKTAAQIFGGDPYYMRTACESEDLKPFNIIDINMGCPVPKVYKNGEGSALLGDIKRAEEIIKECVKSGKIITVKIRTGLVHGEDIARDFAVMAEQAGANLITIHGRVREDYYSGEPDYGAIERAKSAVKIPVIANGGIFDKESADKMIEKTGADGVMIARGGIANPFLALDIADKPHPYSIKEFILKHIENLAADKGDKRAAVEFRKFVPYYFKGIKNAKEIKTFLQSSESALEIEDKIKEFF